MSTNNFKRIKDAESFEEIKEIIEESAKEQKNLMYPEHFKLGMAIATIDGLARELRNAQRHNSEMQAFIFAMGCDHRQPLSGPATAGVKSNNETRAIAHS